LCEKISLFMLKITHNVLLGLVLVKYENMESGNILYNGEKQYRIV